MIKNTFTDRSTSCSMGLPSIFKIFTYLGCRSVDSSFFIVFPIINTLEILIPQPVLPAQAPRNISISRITWEN